MSLGELVDRLAILELKVRRVSGAGLPMCNVSWPCCRRASGRWPAGCPSRGAFDAEVVTMARSMYRLHDRRAAPKRAISMAGGSVLVEKKVHGPG